MSIQNEPKKSAILGSASTPGTVVPVSNITPITPIPNRAPAGQPVQLGTPVDKNGKPVIPAIPINTSNIDGIGKAASAMGGDEVIAFVQNVRKEVVDGYLTQGAIPKGTADKLLFAGMLKDLADAEFTKRKNESDAKTGAAAAIIAAVLAGVPKQTPAAVIPNSAPQSLPDNTPAAPLVPGEADTEPPQMDINSFMAGTEPTPDAS